MRIPPPHSPFQGKYQLEDILGEGGFAIVFRALDVPAQRTVAIKILKPERDGYSAGTESRFMREVRVLAQLRDPHTITMFEFGQTDDGLLFMVFEFVPGRDLADLLRAAQRLDERAAVHIMRQVLKSLREAHEMGLLHRDIKPENIRVFEYMGDPLTVKVLDFGIARAAQVEKGAITQTGAAVGTPRYMSPEQTLGAQLSPASDLYSVGLVAFEMLVGRQHVDEINQPTEQLKRLTSQRSIELPSHVVVSPTLRTVLHTMLKVQSQDRYQTVSEVIRALDGEAVAAPFAMLDTLQSEEGRVAKSTMIERLGTADTAISHVAMAPAPTTEEPKRGSSVVPIAATLLVVFGAMFGGLLLFQEPPADEPAAVKTAPQLPAAKEREADVADLGESQVVVDLDVGVMAGDVSNPDASDAAVARSGCGAAAPEESTASSKVRIAGRTVRWRTRLPKRYDPDTPQGVLVLLHNSWQTPDQFQRQIGFEAIADSNNLIIVAPTGDEQANPWMLKRSVEYLDEVLDHVAEEYCVDPARNYVVGFGAGGRLAERMSCESTHTMSAIASISYRPESAYRVCEPETPVPYIMLSGMKNQWNPVAGGTPCRFLDDLPAKMPLVEHEEMWEERHQCTEKSRKFGKRGKSFCREFSCAAAPLATCHLDSGLIFDVSVNGLEACSGPVAKYPVTRTIWKFFDKHVER